MRSFPLNPIQKNCRFLVLSLATALLVSPAFTQSVATCQTGFNQTNDASGGNYTVGSIVGQNGWSTTNASYGQGVIGNDSVPHQGDGYLHVHGAIGYGIFHNSGINSGLPPDGKIRVSFKLGTPEPDGSDRRFEVRSSALGLLFRVGKYPVESSAYSYAADANGLAFTGYTGSAWRNNSNWAAYSDGRQTIVEMIISRTGLDYHLKETWALPNPNVYGWVSEVWHHCDFSTPLSDLRTFGNIQFVGASEGVWTDAYVDDLKIEYLLPLPVFQTGFNLTNDVSGTNCLTGSIIGQNGWSTTDSSYGQGFIESGTVPHQGDGYLRVHGVVGCGLTHDSLINGDAPPGGKIKISFKIGTPEPDGSDRRFELKSSGLGLLFRVGKYPSASAAYSYAADAKGDPFTGYDGSTWRGNSNWAAYSDGRQTLVEMVISNTTIDYHLKEMWALPIPNPSGWVSEVSHQCILATPIKDLRTFGNLQLIGASEGVWTDAYLDDLKVEYLVEWADAANYADLNSALSAATGSGKSGIFIPAGLTINATTVALPNNFAIVGGDASTSKVHFTAATNYNGFVASGTPAVNQEFRTFTVDSGSVTPPPDPSKENEKGAIKIAAAEGLKISGMKFYDSQVAAVCVSGIGLVVENSHFERGKFVGLIVDGTNSRVSGNSVTNSLWYGMSVAGKNCSVTGNNLSELDGPGWGIYSGSLSNSFFSNNTIAHCREYGFRGFSENFHDNVITDNLVTGIGTVDGVDVEVAGTGIALWPGAHDNVIMRNTVANCLGYGISVVGDPSVDSPNNAVSENAVASSDDPGIVISGAPGTLIRKNSSTNCASTGFTIGSDALNVVSNGCKVFHNRAIGNTYGEGIDVNACANGYFFGNYTQGNVSVTGTVHDPCGFRLNTASTANNQVWCNVSVKEGTHQQYGMVLNHGTYGNQVKYNDLYPNNVGALLNLSTGTNFLANNVGSGSRTILNSAPPVADAGSCAIVPSGQSAVLLDGSHSYFMNGTGTMSYSWQKIYGPSITINNANAAQASFAAPSVTSVQLIGFRLTGSNANGSTFDEVYVVVKP